MKKIFLILFFALYAYFVPFVVVYFVPQDLHTVNVQATNRAVVWTTVREDFPCGPVVLTSPICSPNWGLVSKQSKVTFENFKDDSVQCLSSNSLIPPLIQKE